MAPKASNILKYTPYGGALEFIKCRDREVLLAGPVGTGKTRADQELLHLCAMKWPGMRGLMARKTRVSMTNTMLVTWENHVTPGYWPKSGPSRATRQVYRYQNGSEIDLVGLDNVDRIMSAEYDMILVGEATDSVTEDDWERLITRLRNGVMPFQQIIGDANPGSPTHWLKRRQEEGRLTIIESHLEDNPRFYDHAKRDWTPEGVAYRESLESLTGHRRERLLYGKWVAPEGARFDWLDRSTHCFNMRERFPHGLPDSYKIILGLDYGLRAPAAAIWIAIDHDGDMWVYRESYEKGLDAYDQAMLVVDMTGSNERVSAIYADSACWQEFPAHLGHTNLNVAHYYRRAFDGDSRFGPLLKGWKGEKVHSFATLDQLLRRDNDYPNLWIEDRCFNLWRELTEMTWDPRSEREEVIGQDHAVDALVYAVHTYSALSAPTQPDPPPTAESIALSWAKHRKEQCDKQFDRAMRQGRRFRV